MTCMVVHDRENSYQTRRSGFLGQRAVLEEQVSAEAGKRAPQCVLVRTVDTVTLA